MNLREWLFAKRMSITFFSALMRVNRSSVYHWMKGQNVPSDKIMEKIREISLDRVYHKEELKDVEIDRKKEQA